MSPYPFSEKRQSWWWLLLLFVPGIMRYCAKERMAASVIQNDLKKPWVRPSCCG